jgi:hypothetical protein
MDVLEEGEIPYYDLYSKLFDKSGEQKLIPFLGAGVPLSARPSRLASRANVQFPEKKRIQEAIESLGLEGRPRRFAAIALVIAYLMAEVENSNSQEAFMHDVSRLSAALRERLTREVYPPSSEELTQLISAVANVSQLHGLADAIRGQLPQDLIEGEINDFVLWLRRLVDVTGLSSGDALTSIAGYYETESGRQGLYDLLTEVFLSKHLPTPTHHLLAEAAAAYLNLPKERVINDYLIITTNYDCLMEDALTKANVPFAVLSLNKKDGKIHVRFTDSLKYLEERNEPSYPYQCVLQKRDPLAIVYKIHGCLFSGTKDFDSVVISDNDYVDYISRMSKNEGVIPIDVGNLMRWKPFLFLGYSLKDWNVRSVFETMTSKRLDTSGVRDYLVARRFTSFDKAYCSKHKVIILRADLSTFVERVRQFVPPSAAEQVRA